MFFMVLAMRGAQRRNPVCRSCLSFFVAESAALGVPSLQRLSQEPTTDAQI